MEDFKSPRILIIQVLKKLMDTPSQQGRRSLADHLSKMVKLIEHVKSNVEAIVAEQLFIDVTASERESHTFKNKNERVMEKLPMMQCLLGCFTYNVMQQREPN